MYTTNNISLGATAAALALAAATVGLTAGLAPASAAPTQTPGVHLNIIQSPHNDGAYIVQVRGVFPMNEYDAHGFINNLDTGTGAHGGIGYKIFGDDSGSNDQLRGEQFIGNGPRNGAGGYLLAKPEGISYYQDITVNKDQLDEDFDFQGGTETDEIYVEVKFIDGDGGVRKAYTNEVSRVFDPAR
jgi:hypothetical protein